MDRTKLAGVSAKIYLRCEFSGVYYEYANGVRHFLYFAILYDFKIDLQPYQCQHKLLNEDVPALCFKISTKTAFLGKRRPMNYR